MPSPDVIVATLRSIANDAIALAIAWHVVVAAACLALAAGWRPSQRWAGTLLALPVLSVGIVAFRYGNGFNGLVFVVLAATMLAFARRLAPRPVACGSAGSATLGIALIAFGWTYPHFLDQRPPLLYLVAAPLGLIPCPTLSLGIGFTMLAGGFASRAWRLLLGAAGLFYGVFGVFRLGVSLDLPLAAAAVALIAPSLRRHALA